MMDYSLFNEFLNYDSLTGEVTWKKKVANHVPVGSIAGTINNHGYLMFKLKGFIYKTHRAAWLLYHGVAPTLDIDHINGIATDNRIINLREVSHLENSKNMKLSKSNKSGHQGIYLNKKSNTFRAFIGVNNEQIELGTFKTLKKAIKAREAAEVKYGFHKNHGRTS